MSVMAPSTHVRYITSGEWRQLLDKVNWDNATDAHNYGTEPKECKALPLSQIVGDQSFKLEGLFVGFGSSLLTLRPSEYYLTRTPGTGQTSITHKGILSILGSES
jgi:hypothetical protein